MYNSSSARRLVAVPLTPQALTLVEQGAASIVLPNCCVPCDHVPVRSWPLFRAREVMLALIESFAQEQPS